MLTKNEKKYLAEIVRKNLEHLKKDNAVVQGANLSFLKAEHELEDFLKDLLKKLGG